MVVDMVATDIERTVDLLADCLRRYWHSMERGGGLVMRSGTFYLISCLLGLHCEALLYKKGFRELFIVDIH